MFRKIGDIIGFMLYMVVFGFFIYGITITYPDSPYTMAMWILIIVIVLTVIVTEVLRFFGGRKLEKEFNAYYNQKYGRR